MTGRAQSLYQSRESTWNLWSRAETGDKDAGAAFRARLAAGQVEQTDLDPESAVVGRGNPSPLQMEII